IDQSDQSPMPGTSGAAAAPSSRFESPRPPSGLIGSPQRDVVRAGTDGRLAAVSDERVGGTSGSIISPGVGVSGPIIMVFGIGPNDAGGGATYGVAGRLYGFGEAPFGEAPFGEAPFGEAP